MSASDATVSEVTDQGTTDGAKTQYVWPPGNTNSIAESCSLDFIMLTQKFSSQISVLTHSLKEQQRAAERYKQELTALRMLAGLPDNGCLPGAVAQSIVTCLSNATINDMANGDFTRPSLLHRIGIRAMIKGNINIAPLRMCNEDYLKLVHENDQLRLDVAEVKSNVAKIERQNDILNHKLQKINHNLHAVAEELRICEAEKQETQASCRLHLVHHEIKLKEKDKEVQKARKFVAELRKTTDQHFHELKQQTQTNTITTEKLNTTLKSLAEAKKQAEKYSRDIENKNNAIKLLQRSLKESQEQKTSAQDVATTDRKKGAKRIGELEAELIQMNNSTQRLCFDLARKDESLKQRALQLDNAREQMIEARKLIDEMTQELANKDTAIIKQRELEAELHANLDRQTAQVQLYTELTPSSQKREATYEIILEQLRFALHKVLKGDHSHLVTSWQSEWQRICRLSPKLVKLHETIGKAHFPGVSFSDPSRLNALLKSRCVSSPRSTEAVMAHDLARTSGPSLKGVSPSLITIGKLTPIRPLPVRPLTSTKPRAVNADSSTVSVPKRIRRCVTVRPETS